MNAIATPPALTPEDLLLMPDEGQGFELVHGELREMNMSRESSRVGLRLGHLLECFVDAGHPGWVFGEGTSYRCFPHDPKGTRRADASYISIERLPVAMYKDEGHTSLSPDLVAEVISPNDLAQEVEEKIEDWLSAGVQIIWVVNPEKQTIRVVRQDGGYALVRIGDTLTADGVLPGFSCPVAELFKKPGVA
jgi:Uma2 family endonuclease